MEGNEEMKNLIIISQGNQKTGINKYAINTYEAMKDLAELYFIKFRKNQGYYDVGNSIDGRFPYGNSIFNLNSLLPRLSYSKFIGFLREQKTNGAIIHVSSPHILKIVPGFDNVVTIHDMSPFMNLGSDNTEYMITRRLYKHYMKYKSILTDSDFVKNMILDMGAKGKVERIYPYVSDRFFPLNDKCRLRKKYGLPQDKKLILSVSSNIPRKNLQILPDVLSILGDGYRLVRVGDGIADSYSFTLKDETEMNELYNSCDIFISPSLDEGFGYPVIEALKSGLPIAVSDIPVHREILYKYGMYFDPSSAKDAARTVKDTLETNIGDYPSPAKWLLKFSFNNFREQMLNYYSSIEK